MSATASGSAPSPSAKRREGESGETRRARGRRAATAVVAAAPAVGRAGIGAAEALDFEAVLEECGHPEGIVAGQFSQGGFTVGDHAEQGFEVAGIAKAFSTGNAITHA